ncbi:hypothetical protein NESM_000376200 [Novymonas esmeraldas]|uniref:Uncharacterized protein n=1 Tax=Novymonas esmeraldas TaxID=1808958 RepID=A0AAW0ELG5_9TRYP
MVLRYHSWLPLEAEPEYVDGYTCDHCHRDFLEAPFYHEATTGTDYCVECGGAVGYTALSGLVASLHFSSREDVLRDADTNSVALFAYRADVQTTGIVFANGANLVLCLQLCGGIRDALVYAVKDGKVESKLRISSADVARRFPWLAREPWDVFDVEVHLHALPTVPVPLDDFCIVAYEASDDLIQLRLADSCMQLLNVRRGTEYVVDETATMPLCAFAGGEIDPVAKAAVTEAALTFLKSSDHSGKA